MYASADGWQGGGMAACTRRPYV